MQSAASFGKDAQSKTMQQQLSAAQAAHQRNQTNDFRGGIEARQSSRDMLLGGTPRAFKPFDNSQSKGEDENVSQQLYALDANGCTGGFLAP